MKLLSAVLVLVLAVGTSGQSPSTTLKIVVRPRSSLAVLDPVAILPTKTAAPCPGNPSDSFRRRDPDVAATTRPSLPGTQMAQYSSKMKEFH
ncbi:hypothetical protein P154DRAFT_581423 [Amniculicola lignicola CBS 123094]|uniref:Secreted protein n=1 Tax=Amniculicola lignicola CBS 123094 TaxID=1392246 RepID=A0A6A5W1T3_9PLEO|nr:hypothetical protein P154DRAFT_581423 [Amniculicola lignicola CBS 123094]